MKILAIVGSLRKDSYNLQLAKIAQKILEDQVDFEILDYSQVPLFNQDIEVPAPESVARVREKVEGADGVWFFTPEHNHYFSGVLKNLLDWLSRPRKGNNTPLLGKKPAAISGITPGMSGTALSQDHLVTLLSFLDMDVMNLPRLTIPNGRNQLDEEGRLNLTTSYKYLERQAKAFVDYIEKRK